VEQGNKFWAPQNAKDLSISLNDSYLICLCPWSSGTKYKIFRTVINNTKYENGNNYGGTKMM